MLYRVEMGSDGELIYIPVPPGTTGRTVYNVGMDSDGGLSHASTEEYKPPKEIQDGTHPEQCGTPAG